MKKYNFKFFYGHDLDQDEKEGSIGDLALKRIKELEKLQDDGWEVVNHSSYGQPDSDSNTTYYTIMLRREKK